MNTKRITQTAALGLVLAAVAAPAAGAQQDIRKPDQVAPAAEAGRTSATRTRSTPPPGAAPNTVPTSWW